MDILLSILTVMFVALLLATALTFGVALFIWFAAVALLFSLYMMGRELLRRWHFLREDRSPPGVIEVDYRDISDEE